MIRNYITIALRNIRRNLSYTVINVFGLSLGITCSLVLFLLVMYLTSFDNYHINGDRIYRLVHSSRNQDRMDYNPGVPNPLPEAVRNDINGVQHVLQITSADESIVSVIKDGERKIFEEEYQLAFTDSMYFTFFNQKVLSGTAKLVNPNEAVISTEFAKKYFGTEDVIGEMVRVNNQYDFRITGVMEPAHKNSSFPFELILSFETIRKEQLARGWGSTSSSDQCYLLLNQGVAPEDVNAQFTAFTTKYHGEKDFRQLTYYLQPLSELRYDTQMSNFSNRSIDKSSIWAMVVIAVFLIVTASINFINLTTAVAVKRSKEVGIRKVLGSQRMQLIMQYLSETGMITFIAVIASLGLAELALISMNSFMSLDLHIDLTNQYLVSFIVVIWLVVSVISGIYPAFLLSGFKPVLALKNTMGNRSSGGYMLRRSLVVFQFMISQFLVIGTIILLSQMQYFNQKDMGFSREAIITIPLPESENDGKKRNVRSEVNGLPGVASVSLCYSAPASGNISITDFSIDGVEGDYLAQLKAVDEKYNELFEIEIIAGRDLTASDSINGWLVNEKLLKTIGLTPDEVLGRNMELWRFNYPVVGVVKDFHTFSLEREIDPTIIYTDISSYEAIAVKLKPGQFNETIASIEQAWSRQYPDFLFSYEFLDESIASFYEDTQKMSVLLILFSMIAIVIGCLGLYGLISFMANQKEKEIGVRKALGATTGQIMAIFSKEFTILILIAFLLASPLAGYIMNKWLENYAYRITIDWTMFTGGVATTLAIAFITVGYRSLRAAWTNPADVLRSE